MSNRIRRACAAAAIILFLHAPAGAQLTTLDKGHQILLSRGLQIQGMIDPAQGAGGFHQTTYAGANFTTQNWIWTSNPSQITAPWARWLDYQNENDLTTAEQPLRSSLVNLSVGDEQFLDAAHEPARTNTINWFNNNRAKFPTSILMINHYGGQVNDNDLATFTAAAQPDLLSFDVYPAWNPLSNQNGGSNNNWVGFFADANRYRRHALGSYIGATGNAPRPAGIYLQTFHGDTGSDGQERYRPPSDSEMRLQTFAGWTYGFKMVNAFTYNSGASVLFTGGGTGDNNKTPAYDQLAETFRQSRNLGPGLVRLINDNVKWIPGKNPDGSQRGLYFNNEPWVLGAQDPYITAITAANVGNKNNLQPGDVIIGYFKVLQESMDGAATNQRYFMITNALSDAAGTVADCGQQITVDFNFGASSINSLMRLSRNTGATEVVPLTPLGGSSYRLVLTLDGGTGDLFKFNTGAPFVPEPSALALLIVPAFLLPRRRRIS